jgi:hypothetical protein
MHRPPKLWSAHLDELVASCGGTAAVCKLLDVSPRTLSRWATGNCPKMALDLLWYHSPEGKASALAEYTFLSSLDHTISNARAREIEELKALLHAYELNGPPAIARELESAAPANDEFGALPPQPTRERVNRWK